MNDFGKYKKVDTPFVFIPLSELEMNSGQIDGVPENPRNITEQKMTLLKKDIKDHPEMLEYRGLLVYPQGKKFVIIGGNMRYTACKALGYTEAPCVVLPADTTVEQLKAYAILDNAPFGQWDWDLLANEWDAQKLTDWGVDLPVFTEEDNNEGEEVYTAKIITPTYEPKNVAPALSECADTTKCDELVTAINKSKLNNDVKEFLTMAAQRHIVFNYEKIADYYANAPKEVQALMEDNALVIIDFDKAIEDGFVTSVDKIKQMWEKDHGGEDDGNDEE